MTVALPAISGVSVTVLFASTCPIETVDESIRGACAVTSRVSVTAPISRVTSIVIRSSNRTSMCGRTDFLKPGASTVSE